MKFTMNAEHKKGKPIIEVFYNSKRYEGGAAERDAERMKKYDALWKYILKTTFLSHSKQHWSAQQKGRRVECREEMTGAYY